MPIDSSTKGVTGIKAPDRVVGVDRDGYFLGLLGDAKNPSKDKEKWDELHGETES
jgi:hypothetical protein